jgi:hypothetical protein
MTLEEALIVAIGAQAAAIGALAAAVIKLYRDRNRDLSRLYQFGKKASEFVERIYEHWLDRQRPAEEIRRTAGPRKAEREAGGNAVHVEDETDRGSARATGGERDDAAPGQLRG